MSANLVSKTLIDLLLTAAIQWRDAEPFTFYWVRAGTQPVTTDTADRVGEMLWRASWDPTEGWALPEERWLPELPAYVFEPLAGPVEPVVVLRQISYYTYQTADDQLELWLLSEPQAFLDALARAAHRQLPGWRDAPWGVQDHERDTFLRWSAREANDSRSEDHA